MVIDITSTIEVELLKLVKELQDKHIELGQKASGKWVEGLEVVASHNGGSILAEDHTKFLTIGRPPNTDQSPEALRKFAGWAGNTWAKDWVADKGISISPFAVAYSIGKNGTEIYNQGGTDLVDGVLTDERIQQVIDAIGESLRVEIRKEILRE